MPAVILSETPPSWSFFSLEFEYREDSVVISGNLITRYVVPLCRRRALIVTAPYLLAVGQARWRTSTIQNKSGLSYLTSPGTAFPFVFALVESLCGAQKRSEVIGPMVFPPGTPL